MTYSSNDFQGAEFDAVLARQEAHAEVAEEVRSTFYDSVVEMFEFDLSVLPGFSGTDHYYFTNFVTPEGEKVKWRRSETSTADQEYEPIPILATGFDRTTKGQIPQPELQISNIFGTLSGLIASLDDLIGVKVYRRRTLAKYLGNFTTKDYDYYFPTDIYYIERKAAETNMSVTFQLASPLDLEGTQLPRRVITHNHCLWEYRGIECGYGGENSRPSELNGLPVANSFDEAPTSGALFDSFDADEQAYLVALGDYLTKKKTRDEAEATKNLKLGDKEAACGDGTSTSEYFYQFDTDHEDPSISADDASFVLIREVDNRDELVTIVLSGQTVSGSQYTFDPKKKGRAGDEIADNTIQFRSYPPNNGVYEIGGVYDEQALTFAIFAEGVTGAYVFENGVFSVGSKTDINEEERKVGDSLPFGLRQVEVVTQDNPGGCATASGEFNTANGAFSTAEQEFNDALATLNSTWNGLTNAQQEDLMKRFDVCGKRLTSCQLRFGNTNLPYGAFPGANLTRG